MPRFNNVNGTRIQYTAAEETAQDALEAQAAIDKTAREARQASIDALQAKIDDGSAIYAELLEFMQYQTGSK